MFIRSFVGSLTRDIGLIYERHFWLSMRPCALLNFAIFVQKYPLSHTQTQTQSHTHAHNNHKTKCVYQCWANEYGKKEVLLSRTLSLYIFHVTKNFLLIFFAFSSFVHFVLRWLITCALWNSSKQRLHSHIQTHACNVFDLFVFPCFYRFGLFFFSVFFIFYFTLWLRCRKTRASILCLYVIQKLFQLIVWMSQLFCWGKIYLHLMLLLIHTTTL